METQLLYGLSILMAVGFGYFVASTMLRGGRNTLIAQGRREGETERAELEEQVKLLQTRTQEIEKEREQERADIEKLLEENGKLHILHNEADQRVADARRSAEEYWEQVVGDLRLAAEERSQAPAAEAGSQPTDEQLQQAVEEAKRAAEEHWQRIADSIRAEADIERAQLVERIAASEATIAASEAAWETKLAALSAELKQAREQSAIAAITPSTATSAHESPSHESMLEAFRSVAAEALYANNEKFLDLARVALERIQETAHPEVPDYSTAVNELIDPIRETLAKVDSNLGQMEKERQSALSNLTDLVNHLVQQGRELRQETTGLARALRPRGWHGRWGELQLRRVVELAGMLEHCDYEDRTASGNAGAGNETLRPEMVVHLPNHRDIVVDANVSLSAYLESVDALDEAVRTEKLRAHAAAVRAHLRRLSGADYWSQFALAPEFVVAFLPSETVFSAALEQDPALIEFGAERRVILATPTTLIALLKATAHGWQQQQLADNARIVSELGKTLYERLVSFTGHMDDLRRNLERSVESFNRGVSSLESRVLVSARRFQELDVLPVPEIPVLDPVATLPRSLQALESATGNDPASPPAIATPIERAESPAVQAEVPLIDLPIPPMAPVIVCEPRVVSEAHVVSEPRIVREPTFVSEDHSVIP